MNELQGTDEAQLKEDFETVWERLSARRYRSSRGVMPAIRYVLESRGKRVRPLMALLSAASLGRDPRSALCAAVAVEMIHVYSLVHDDLPCMDDDDLRRGRSTTHKVHGEALALLAGDGLLTDAFTILADGEIIPETPTDLRPTTAERLAMVAELSRAAGSLGMVDGQALDLYWTARQDASRQDLDAIHEKKTGCLIGAACAMGALAGGADRDTVDAFRRFGQLVGLAFQIRDDLLDETSGMGKTAGKDRAVGKLTYLTWMTSEQARAEAEAYTREAVTVIERTGTSSNSLVQYASKLLNRTV